MVLVGRCSRAAGTSPRFNLLMRDKGSPSSADVGMARRPSALHLRTNIDMNLKGKSAVVYGAAGSIGTAVSQAHARGGARVFLCGRTLRPLDALAKQLASSEGSAEVTVLDALNSDAVDRHAEAIVAKAGSLDISYNLIAIPHIQGRAGGDDRDAVARQGSRQAPPSVTLLT